MFKKGRLFMTLILGGMLLFADSTYASKTTDLMSGALKQRSSGNLNSAIKDFKKAVDSAPTILQRNLALFMLGDCQMEAGRYSEAVTTYSELSKKATTADERAEALYKMMEANSNIGDSKKVSESYAELKKKYSKSAYFEIATAFMKAEKIMESEYTGSIAVEEPKKQEKSKAKTAKVPAKTESRKQETKVKEEEPTNKKTEKASKNATVKAETKKSAKTREASVKKLDAKTTALLEDILYIEPLSDSERDSLVSRILSYQDKLKSNEKGPGKDKVLFELAGATARFGELLEACKTYDKILSLHPTSAYVEEAYYQAIRLRAMLGVHQTVVEWARAFNITFPKSKFQKQITALTAYSQAGGNVQITPNGGSKPDSSKNGSKYVASDSKKTSDESESTGNSGIDAVNDALKASALYKTAVKKMNDGNYMSVLGDLKVLAGKFGDSSQLWWDMTLVYVQLEEFKEADKSIRKMLLLDPDNSDANSLLGYIQYRLENYEEAASAYENAGEAEGEGVTFFDAKTASERMKKNASK